jgi:VIT1/CCC1 family predicted Fe2+/Mn2+ transporter
VNAGAWLVGVMIPVAAPSVVPDGWPAPIHAAVGVLAAVAMGLTVRSVTDRTLERLLQERTGGAPPVSSTAGPRRS